jgi:hypothetical protein
MESHRETEDNSDRDKIFLTYCQSKGNLLKNMLKEAEPMKYKVVESLFYMLETCGFL